MKKLAMSIAFVVLALAMTGCGSYRTPAGSKNQDTNYYLTFFGISLESAIYGDGLIVNPMGGNK